MWVMERPDHPGRELSLIASGKKTDPNWPESLMDPRTWKSYLVSRDWTSSSTSELNINLTVPALSSAVIWNHVMVEDLISLNVFVHMWSRFICRFTSCFWLKMFSENSEDRGHVWCLYCSTCNKLLHAEYKDHIYFNIWCEITNYSFQKCSRF